MIKGIGIDIVELDRFRRAMARGGKRFLERIYTSGELSGARPRKDRLQYFAARFAAKEAILKALGTGWSGGIAWTDVEIVGKADGAPSVKLSGVARTTARKRHMGKIHLSLTHTESSAAAVAIAEGPR
mgnify:CR=1 FL=1